MTELKAQEQQPSLECMTKKKRAARAPAMKNNRRPEFDVNSEMNRFIVNYRQHNCIQSNTNARCKARPAHTLLQTQKHQQQSNRCCRPSLTI